MARKTDPDTWITDYSGAVTHRKCSICNEYVELSACTKDKTKPNGVGTRCKSCDLQRSMSRGRKGKSILARYRQSEDSLLTDSDLAIRFATENPHTVKTFNMHTKTGKCFNWTGAVDKYGYGRYTLQSEGVPVAIVAAHRLAYALRYGFAELPKSDTKTNQHSAALSHTCGNKACVNPEHLEPRLNSDNYHRLPKKQITLEHAEN